MIRIICPECKNGYLEASEEALICPECQAQIEKDEENLLLGIQYYNECDYDKANDCLMKYIVKNGAEPRAIFYKALCDGFCFDEDTLSLSETYEKLLDSLKNTSKEDFPKYLALANDEAEKLEKAIAQSHIHLFADADAEKIKKEVSAIITLQNEAKAFRIKLNALTNEFNDSSATKLSVKFSDSFLVDSETATQIGDMKFRKISENIASHTVFTGILSTDIKNLEIYYRCIVMFFKKNRQKYEFLMASAEKFAELAALLENGQYNTIKGTASIGEKLKVAGYEFFHESLKDADDDYATQTETVVVIENEPQEEQEAAEMEDISSTTEFETVTESSEIEAPEIEETSENELQAEENTEAEVSADATQIISTEEITDSAAAVETPEEATEVLVEEADGTIEEIAEAEKIAEEIAEEAADDNAVTEETTVIETAEVIEEEAKDAASEKQEIPEEAPVFEVIEDEAPADDAPAEVSAPVKNKHKTHYAPFVALLALVFGIAVIICATVIPRKLNEKNYAQAGELSKQGKFEEAAAVYLELDDYEDSQSLYKAARYSYAEKLEKEENFEEAKKVYEALAAYEDSMAKATSCAYNIALKTLDEGKYDEAKALFEEIPEYADSKEKAKECVFQKGCALIGEKKFEDAITVLSELEGYKPAKEKILEAKYKFCEANPTKENKTTVKFIDDLIEARYKDSVLLRKKILGEVAADTSAGAVSVINYSATDLKENLKEADRTKPIYFHATVTDPELYGKTLTAKFTTSVGYTERKTLTLSESDNTYHLLYPRTTVSNYTVEFSLLDSDGTVLVSQVITIK